MNAKEILEELRPLGRESYKSVLLKHGVQEPCWGVKIEELKKIQKRIKHDYALSLELFDTGIYDVMYLAGLIANDARMTRANLQHWLAKGGPILAGNIVAWVAAGSPHGRAIALEWIDLPREHEVLAGWATLGSLVSIKPDAELDLAEVKRLLQRVQKTIHQAPNDARYAMNNFVICVAAHVQPLNEFAKHVAEKIGRVSVDMGDTACQVPFAPDYIKRVEARGTIGKKRKTAKC